MTMRNVLIVEDDICTQTVMTQLLQTIDSAIKADWATSAEKAKALLRMHHYDLTIADHTLNGEGTGLDLWRLCQDKYPSMPFFMISGLGIPEFFKLVGENQIMPAFLPKPFHVGECKQLLKCLLDSNASK
jgi:DNA-binding NtrC family response regulator